jgi:hypothetical protein
MNTMYWRKVVVVLSVVLGLSLSGGGLSLFTAVPAALAACARWDISGDWQYQASAGGYGVLHFTQDA